MSAESNTKDYPVEHTPLLWLRSIAVHLTVWILVAVFGPIAIVLSPFTKGAIVFFLGRIWGWCIMKLAGTTLEVDGIENLAGEATQVIVGNHTSNFDIYVMLFVLHRKYFRIVCKKQLAYIPIFGWALWVSGFPFLNRSNSKKAQATMEKTAALMKRTGISILAFPEGTRNVEPGLMRFKKGPFVLALEAGVPIVPFAIYGAREVQPRHAFWIHPGKIRVSVLPEVKTDTLTYKDHNALVDQVRSSIERRLAEIDSEASGENR